MPYNLQVHGILKGRLPVLLFGDAPLVGLGKCRIVVELNGPSSRRQKV